jgi:hypothetical protein
MYLSRPARALVVMTTNSRDDNGLAMAFGGPTASSWREQALTRVAEMEILGDEFAMDADSKILNGMRRHLRTARNAADGKEHPPWRRLMPLLGGSPLERTASNLHAAEVDLLRLAPSTYLCGQLPSLLAQARAQLAYEDPRRQAMEAICSKNVHGGLSPTEKDTVIAVARAANSAARREIVQVRSFRNVLYATAIVLAIAAGGLALLAWNRPDLVPLCFHPGDSVVCPTTVVGDVPEDAADEDVYTAIRGAVKKWDVLLVAILGLAAAVLSAALSLRKLQGTTLPYSLPVALAVLKLPSGALTAVMGIVLMRGEFVPGLSALDTPGQILAWAILFGYAQQLFTQFVDQRAQGLLDQVSSQDIPRSAVPTATVVPRVAEPAPGNGAAVVGTQTMPAS